MPVSCNYCGHKTVQLLLQRHLASCPSITILEGQKVCTTCQSVLSDDDFPAHRNSPGGRSNTCKKCACKKATAWYHTPKNHMSRREYLEYKLYGLTPEGRKALEAEQNGLCAICGKPPSGGPKNTRLAVDHDHDFPGTHRGLLCEKCNTGLGAFDDSTALMHEACSYLIHYRPVPVVS